MGVNGPLAGTFVLLLIGGMLFWLSGWLRRRAGMPAGRVIYSDMRTWRNCPEPLYDSEINLTGKPDYLVQKLRYVLPVEVKSSQAPDEPYRSHVLQLAAYCLLVEETTGQTPPHGWLKYIDTLYEVDFTPELRRELLDTIVEMRQAHLAETVKRNHNQPNKCHACGFYKVCDEALT